MRRAFAFAAVVFAVGGLAVSASSRIAADPPVTVAASSVQSPSTHLTNVSGSIETEPVLANASYSAVIEGPPDIRQEVHGTLDDKGKGTFNFGLRRPPAKKGTYTVTVTVGKAPETVTTSTEVQVTFAPPQIYVITSGKLTGLWIGVDSDQMVYADDNPGDESTGKIVTGADGVDRFEGTSSNETLKNGEPAKFNVKVAKQGTLSPVYLSVSALANTEIVTRSYLRKKPPEKGNQFLYALYAWYEFSHGNQIVPPIVNGKEGVPKVKTQIEALGASGAMTKEAAQTYANAIDEIRAADAKTFEDLRTLQKGFRPGDPKKTPLGPKEKQALVDSAKERLTKTIRLKQEILKAIVEAKSAVRCPNVRGAACPPVTIGTVGSWSHNVTLKKSRVCVDVTTSPRQASISGSVSGPSGSAQLSKTALGANGAIQVSSVIAQAGVYTWVLIVYNASGRQTATTTTMVTVEPPPTNGPPISPPCKAPTG